MLIHSVYFWLKQDLSDEEKEIFYQGLIKLKDIPTVKDLYIGVPAQTEKRPVVDNSYTYGIVVVFNDLSSHDAYQLHPIHQEFLTNFKSYWDKVLVYDIQV